MGVLHLLLAPCNTFETFTHKKSFHATKIELYTAHLKVRIVYFCIPILSLSQLGSQALQKMSNNH